jgi:hypothetical protein
MARRPSIQFFKEKRSAARTPPRPARSAPLDDHVHVEDGRASFKKIEKSQIFLDT